MICHIHAVKLMHYEPLIMCWTCEKQPLPTFHTRSCASTLHSLNNTKAVTRKTGPHHLWLTQSGFPKRQSGQVKRRHWWCHRKEEQGQLEKGRPDDRWQGRTHTYTHTRTHTHTHTETDVHFLMVSNRVHSSNIHCIPPLTTPHTHTHTKKKTLNLFHIFRWYRLIAGFEQSYWQSLISTDLVFCLSCCSVCVETAECCCCCCCFRDSGRTTLFLTSFAAQTWLWAWCN